MSGAILRRRDQTDRPPRVGHYSSAVNTLLTIEDVGDAVPPFLVQVNPNGRGFVLLSDVRWFANKLFPNWIPANDAVQKAGCLLGIPQEITLELRDLNVSAFEVVLLVHELLGTCGYVAHSYVFPICDWCV